MIESKDTHSIMLTGGSSIPFQYKFLSNYPVPANTKFYFTDERCVSRYSPRSNYRGHIKFFVKNFTNHPIIRMCSDSDDLEMACKNYEAMLPNNIDLLFLSMGEDGHIASIFPNSSIIHENSSSVMITSNPYTNEKRLTVTSLVIKNAKQVIVFALGKKKQKFYDEIVMKDPGDIYAIPARLVLNRTWIFDAKEMGI